MNLIMKGYWIGQELAIYGIGLACFGIAIFRRWFLRAFLRGSGSARPT